MRYINADEVSRFNLNKTARELLLSNKLHKISNKCCKYLKKEPLKRFEKQSRTKTNSWCKSRRKQLEKIKIYELLHKRYEVYTNLGPK